MPFWRAHPIRLAALLGAIFGLLDTLVVEINGVIHHSSLAVIGPLLITEPGARFGFLPTALILLVELAANILVWAILFALPVALIVALRRAFRALRRH